MSTDAPQALLEALALARAPRGPRPGPSDRLPDGVFLLLRIAAGEEQALQAARERAQEDSAKLREAATFYLQQVLFAPESDSYRVLGVNPDESEERLREHYRWLARWLHPDRNQDEWEAHYAERVNQAWQNVRNAERRQRYDEDRLATAAAMDEHFERKPVPRAMPRAPAPEVDDVGINLRWLPQAIFGGLGVIAVLTVIAFSALHFASPESNRVAQAEPEGPVEMPEALQAARLAQEAEAQAAAEPIAVAPEPAAASLPAAMEPAPMPVPEPPPAPEPTAAPPPVALAATPPPPKASVAPAPTPVPKAPPVPPRNPQPVAAAAPPPAVRPSMVAAVSTPEPAAPAPAPSTVKHEPSPPPPARPVEVDERIANGILGNFSQAYSAGDVGQMRAMFTPDAVGPGGGLGAIMAGYSRVFRSSSDRTLSVRNVSWFMTGSTLTIVASYDASVSDSRKATPRRTHGDLRLDLRKQGDEWRIFRLKHDERPG